MEPIVAAGSSALPRGLPPWLRTGSHDRAQAPAQRDTPGRAAENTYRVMPASSTRTDPTRVRPSETTVGRLGVITSSSGGSASCGSAAGEPAGGGPTPCGPAAGEPASGELAPAGEAAPTRTPGGGAARWPAAGKGTLPPVTAPVGPTAPPPRNHTGAHPPPA